MSRLVRALRNKKSDDVVTPVPSTNPKDRKKTLHRKKRDVNAGINDAQFRTFINMYVSNKETIKKLDAQNKEYYPKLVEYTESHGATDDKGHKLFKVGDILSKVQVSEYKILLIEKVEKLIYKLRKKKKKKKKKNID